jgi:pimeloyl-ACP methyl ester carboxylesterase
LRRFLVPVLFTFAGVSFSSAQSVPTAIYTDPPADKDHPARMTVLHIPTHGLLINGLLYSPPGVGPHPTLVICHGLPGNEKNLDLAQAVRRAGWNAVTFNYRGSWGSPGQFRFGQSLEDADAVLAYLRTPAVATKLGIDPKRIAITGHSMGGWVAAHTASRDHDLIGAILICMGDLSRRAEEPRQKLVEHMADNMEALAGVTAESMADEALAHAKEFRVDSERVASGLAQIRLLALTSDDGLAGNTEALVHAIEAQGGKNVKTIHAATDHSWSDKRIFLESTIISWLSELH